MTIMLRPENKPISVPAPALCDKECETLDSHLIAIAKRPVTHVNTDSGSSDPAISINPPEPTPKSDRTVSSLTFSSAPRAGPAIAPSWKVTRATPWRVIVPPTRRRIACRRVTSQNDRLAG